MKSYHKFFLSCPFCAEKKYVQPGTSKIGSKGRQNSRERVYTKDDIINTDKQQISVRNKHGINRDSIKRYFLSLPVKLFYYLVGWYVLVCHY